MTRVYVADAKPEERSAFRWLFLDLNMEVVGEAADWQTTLAYAPATCLDMLLVEWDLLPSDRGAQTLAELRLAHLNLIIVVLLSHPEARQQAALSSGADMFISRSEAPELVAEHLLAASERLFVNRNLSESKWVPI